MGKAWRPEEHPDWEVPDWFPAMEAAHLNSVPLWKWAGLPEPTDPDDPLVTIYTNIALDWQWAKSRAQEFLMRQQGDLAP